MKIINAFKQVDASISQFWTEHGLKPKDFFCRSCGKFMLDIDQLKDLQLKHYFHVKQPKIGLFLKPSLRVCVAPNESNRWLVLGRTLSGKTYFRHLCWDCFFDKLFAEDKDIKQKARKGKWYAKIANGARIIPSASTSPSFYFKWLFDITDEELDAERMKFDTASLESFIRRYGKEEGIKRFEEYAKRQAYTCSQEYFGMTDDEYKAFNDSRASTKENFIKRYGYALGVKRWNEYCAYESYAGTSLTWFIDKYGQEDGVKKYNEIQASKTTFKRGYSFISQGLFRAIDEELGNYAKESRWEEKNHEFEVFGELVPEARKVLKVDYFLNGKIIEFNGDVWHANPKIYKAGDIIKTYGRVGRKVEDIWEWDKRRMKAIEANGYKVLIVWESDYRTNPKKELQRCISFLQE